LKSVQSAITAENDKFDHTDQTNKAIEDILTQAQAELAPASALGVEFNSKKYDTILRKSFNENMNGVVITELFHSEEEKTKAIQAIIDMVKKDPAKKNDIIQALKYLKSEAEKKAGTPPEAEATPSEEPAKPEATSTEDKKPSHYASALGDPATLESITKWAGRAASLVTWVVSKENDKAGAFLSSIGGKISTTIQSLIDTMKKGEADAKQLNDQLKSICKMMQDQERTMSKTYAMIKEKAKGKDIKKMIDEARKNRDSQTFLDTLKDKNLDNELKKSLKPKKLDANFINDLKKTIPDFDVLLKAAIHNSDAASEKKLVDAMKKYLTSAGAAKYPYLNSLYAGDQDDAVKSALVEISSNVGSILHFTPQEMATFRAAQSGGELDTYFLCEKTINDSLDRFAELILSIKKKIDIKDLQKKTGLSKDTINNWIEYEKKTSGNQKVIKAIGNQQAQ
jgi:hypothetical protein